MAYCRGGATFPGRSRDSTAQPQLQAVRVNRVKCSTGAAAVSGAAHIVCRERAHTAESELDGENRQQTRLRDQAVAHIPDGRQEARQWRIEHRLPIDELRQAYAARP
eukprot:scaffold4228_cov135-Isochrysis_galbana.AAC.6